MQAIKISSAQNGFSAEKDHGWFEMLILTGAICKVSAAAAAAALLSS